MLGLHSSALSPSRRQFLSIGSLALGGLSLSSLLAARASQESANSLANILTGKSVIFLYQQGGPSQFETFDPKPEAAEGVRTVTGVTKTKLPGVIFGDTMKQLAEMADKFTIVRSFYTGNGGHNLKLLVSDETLQANLGVLYSRIAGANNPATGMPTNAVLFPQAVDDKVAKGSGRGDIAATGPFGGSFAPFIPGGKGELLKNLRLNITPEQLEDRHALLNEFDRLKRDYAANPVENFDSTQRQAYDVLLSGRVAEALDLSRENSKVVEKYDTSRFAAKHDWKKARRGGRGYYTGHAKTLGKSLLLARRLCEAGCGFVTVHTGYEGVWDMHADGNNLNMVDGMEAVGRSFDHAVAAFIQDLEERGLADKILLVATGEMGRTPRINKNGGRDHWSKLAPLLLYGGGTPGGHVIGRSNKDGGEPASHGYGPETLISTILHTVFDAGILRLRPEFGDISRLAEPEPIVEMG